MERWWGFRPCTPDEGPLLGTSGIPGLWLATGHHRNGVLLAAITAELLSQRIKPEPQDQGKENLAEQALLDQFHWTRFQQG